MVGVSVVLVEADLLDGIRAAPGAGGRPLRRKPGPPPPPPPEEFDALAEAIIRALSHKRRAMENYRDVYDMAYSSGGRQLGRGSVQYEDDGTPKHSTTGVIFDSRREQHRRALRRIFTKLEDVRKDVRGIERDLRDCLGVPRPGRPGGWDREDAVT